MTVLFIIFGILMLVCGFSCLFTPLLNFLSAGYFIIILITAYGIIGIIRGIRQKKYGVGFVFSILSVILGVCMLFFPNLVLITDSIMLYLTAAWFVLMGIVTITSAVTVTKATGSSIWILQLILGILAVILGVISFFQPIIMALSIGTLIGIYFIETGFTLIFTGIAIKD